MDKKLIILNAVLFIFCIGINSQTVKIDKEPGTIEEFIELRNKIAKTPEGGAAILMLAIKIYDSNKELGKKCLVVAADKSRLQEGGDYKGRQLFIRDMNLIEKMTLKYKNIMNSYIEGSSPQNGYKVKLPYVYHFSSNPSSGDPLSGKYKIFVKCSGASSPRPIGLSKNNRGYWKATSWGSLLAGMMKSTLNEDDDI